DAEDDEEDDEEGDEAASGDLLAGYPDDAEDIQLLHSKIASLPLLRLPRFAKTLHTLCLRQNAISSLPASEFGPLTELEELDVYDNAIKDEGVGKGSGVVGLAKLRILDLSFNLLRAVPPILDTLPSLHTVYFVQNKITKIDGLASPSIGASLTSLELGGNRIRMIEGLGALVNLEELWLGKNKITKLENLSSLTKLRILSIQSNRIVKIENLDALENLEELYLSHNGVEKLEGLEKNVKLTTLDVGNNRVPEVENLSHLKALTELWLNDNQIPTLHALSPELGHIAALETIYLEGNPCQRDDQSGYRRKVQLALPQVQQVDAT
ncbi:L domain-like protein, partial [Clavulina sp. PMI_390]